MTGCCEIGMGLLPLTLAMLGACAANTKRVPIRDPVGGDGAPSNGAGSVFLTTLARESDAPVDFAKMPLGRTRLAQLEGECLPVAFRTGPIELQRLDLVRPVGGRLRRDVGMGARAAGPALRAAFAERTTG